MQDEDIIKEIEIIRIKGTERIRMTDPIIDEDILKIYINEKMAFQMVFSKTRTESLAAGFLFTQGIILERSDILDIRVSDDRKTCRIILAEVALKRLADFRKAGDIKGSSGGNLLKNLPDRGAMDPGKGLTISPAQVLSLIRLHWDHSERFQKTGALHSAGLCTPDSLLSYYEDIGRHNAVDKLAGDLLLKETDASDKIATLSCRMSLEIIGKIIRTGIPIVISNAAPTLSSVRLAKEAGLTIIGFARENRFNIYTHGQRIV